MDNCDGGPAGSQALDPKRKSKGPMSCLRRSGDHRSPRRCEKVFSARCIALPGFLWVSAHKSSASHSEGQTFYRRFARLSRVERRMISIDILGTDASNINCIHIFVVCYIYMILTPPHLPSRHCIIPKVHVYILCESWIAWLEGTWYTHHVLLRWHFIPTTHDFQLRTGNMELWFFPWYMDADLLDSHEVLPRC